MGWKTARNNGISLISPSLGRMDLRIVWDEKGSDIAYIVPICDRDNGNSNARLIAAAPDLWNACRLMWDAVAECGCQVPPQVLDAARHCKQLVVKSF